MCKREWTLTRHNCELSRTHQYTCQQEVKKIHMHLLFTFTQIRGGIQKLVDKLNNFFMHYHIFTKTSNLKHSYLEQLQVIDQIDSDVHTKVTVTIATCIYGKCGISSFQTMISVFILIRFMNFFQIPWEMFNN